MEFESVVIPPDVLKKIERKHHVHEYEVYQALENAKQRRKSRGRWEVISRTMGGRKLRVCFEEFKNTITVVSAWEDR